MSPYPARQAIPEISNLATRKTESNGSLPFSSLVKKLARHESTASLDRTVVRRAWRGDAALEEDTRPATREDADIRQPHCQVAHESRRSDARGATEGST